MTIPAVKDDVSSLATAALLQDSGITTDQLSNCAGSLATAVVDFADLYLEKTWHESWQLDEGRIDSGSFTIIQGMALRAVCGEANVSASADLINADTLQRIHATVQTGPQYLAGSSHQIHLPAADAPAQPRYDATNPMAFPDIKRIALLSHIDKHARACDKRIHNVMASLSLAYKTIMVARSDGSLHPDIRPMYGIRVSVILRDGDKVEVGGSGTGARGDPADVSPAKLTELVTEAIRLADLKLTATPAPAGTMPVVMGNGWAGILLHEAVGHGLEGDFNRKGQSAFAGRIGDRVAPAGVTVVDDGTLFGRRGSLTCDDEGVPAGYNVLIEDGILKNYMQDLVNASLMKRAPTGNGRRESYRHEPMPRMTNTYMLNGTYTPEEIIASVSQGLYCKSFRGGSVDITNGNFNFDVEEAYMIENGKLGRHVKGATVIGNGPESMTKMSMVADDLLLDPGIGTCGKNGQWVAVGVGQPHCKVDEMLVGGTEI